MDRKSALTVAGVLLLFSAIGAGTFYLGGSSGAQTAAVEFARSEGAPDNVAPTVPETRPASEGWRGYENRDFRFALLFPDELGAREYKEAGGAISVVFENPENGEGFQIYVTPYAETQITRERLSLDLSSGVMEEPVDVIIGGVRGTMFWSRNSIMGETREVWFINNGFLYEVVTYKHLDSWLASIMQTWTFL